MYNLSLVMIYNIIIVGNDSLPTIIILCSVHWIWFNFNLKKYKFKNATIINNVH